MRALLNKFLLSFLVFVYEILMNSVNWDNGCKTVDSILTMHHREVEHIIVTQLKNIRGKRRLYSKCIIPTLFKDLLDVSCSPYYRMTDPKEIYINL